jgi:hypothetical protein
MEHACSGVPSILGYSLPVAGFSNATRGKNACWLSTCHGTNQLKRAPA